MELTEAAQRIVRHHVGVIVVLFLAGLAIPFVLNATKEDSYVASTRIDAGNTSNAEESNALADSALGIITSPGRVEAALKEAGVDRNADKVAKNNVQISPIGTSGVLELSVSDPDAKAAASIANALSEGLVTLRRDAVSGVARRRLIVVDRSLEQVNVEISALTEQAREPDAPIEAITLQLNEASGRRGLLENERQSLVATLAATPQPNVIDTAEVPASPASSGLLAQMAVGGILGLVLGLAAAAALEALRPTIVGPDALARTLDTPVLGRLPQAPQQATTLEDRWLPYYVSLAASRAEVKVARLVSVGPPVDLHRLAAWLHLGVDPFLEIEVVDPRPPGQRLSRRIRDDLADPYLDVDMVGSQGSAPQERFAVEVERQSGPPVTYEDDRSWTGIVVVAPHVLRRNDLAVLEHQLTITQRPLLGIVAYKQRRRFGRRTTSVPEVSPPFPVERPAPRPRPAAGGSWSSTRNPSRRSPTPPR